VATFDKHTLFIWSTKDADKRPLTLHHTKAFTVCLSPPKPSRILHLPSEAWVSDQLVTILGPLIHHVQSRMSECLELKCVISVQCVAIDATEDRVAAGDVSGRISMWNGFAPAVAAAAAAPEDRAAGELAAQSAQQQKRKSRDIRDAGLAKEVMHWHSSAVRSVVFSQDGAYLLSGGAEAVLVSRFLPVLHYSLQCYSG
jgi:WD40 repeat protein